MRPIFLVFGIILLLAGCTVQKRRYRNGFYVQHTKQTPNSIGNALAKKNVRPLVTAKNKCSDTPNLPNESIAALAATEDSHSLIQQSDKEFVTKIQPIKKHLPPDTCDIMVFANGNELNVKVTEVTPYEIKYYRCDIPNGPLHISSRNDLFMIKYNNGSREMVQTKSEDKRTRAAFPKQNKVTPDVVWLALLCCLLYYFSPIGLVLGIIGLEKIKRNPQKYKGKQYAVLAIVFSSLIIALAAMLVLLTFL